MNGSKKPLMKDTLQVMLRICHYPALIVSVGLDAMGFLYQMGQGVDVDQEKAFEYYKKAAEAGDGQVSATSPNRVTF